MQTEQNYTEAFFYSYNPLRAYPIIYTTQGGVESLICPFPTLLIWRFTAGLYYELCDDSRFSNAFGASFQDYVGQVVRRTCVTDRFGIIPEQRYGQKKARKDTVDWIVSDNDVALFLECKAKRPSWGTKMALDDLTALEVDLGYIADAVVQLYKTIGD